MRRYVIPILILFCILAAAFYSLLNTTLVLSFLVPRIVKARLKTIELQSFEFKQQTFDFPDTLALSAVKMAVAKDDVSCRIDIAKLTIFNIKRLLEDQREIKFSLEGLSVDGEEGAVKGLDATVFLALQNQTLAHIESIVRVGFLQWRFYQIRNISGRIQGDQKHIDISDVVVNDFDGTARGQIALQYTPELNYSVWLELTRWRLEGLRRMAPVFLVETAGVFEGNVRLTGSLQRVNILDVNLVMLEGGHLGANLLKPVVEHMKPAENKEKWSAWIGSSGKVPVDNVAVQIRSNGDKQVRGIFEIYQEQPDVHLKGSFAVDMQEGLAKWLFPQ